MAMEIKALRSLTLNGRSLKMESLHHLLTPGSEEKFPVSWLCWRWDL
jgi:hypothetical protein